MRSVLLLSVLACVPAPARAESINLFAAGSLKAALTEVAMQFEARQGGRVQVASTFAASGLLRERIEKGEAAGGAESRGREPLQRTRTGAWSAS